jgi:hypothetical protein
MNSFGVVIDFHESSLIIAIIIPITFLLFLIFYAEPYAAALESDRLNDA